MKKYDVVTARTYQQNGEEKKAWRNVGTLTIFPATSEKAESGVLELHMFPSTRFSVFVSRPRGDDRPQDNDIF